MSELNAGIAYRDDLAQYVIDADKDSAILKAQQTSDRNVLTMEPLDADTKTQMISYLGGDETPYVITIYPRSFNAKDDVLKYLDAFNKGKSKEDQVIYTDMADTITSLSGGIIDGITMVLVAFAATSLIVSLIMIAIITYTSQYWSEPRKLVCCVPSALVKRILHVCLMRKPVYWVFFPDAWGLPLPIS
ncbi:MAG: hypothetical protein KH431_01200 [Erysipelotrichaceae bacterium]|nr:hypothetical protein [Erysipelotrichaceae bacterium]